MGATCWEEEGTQAGQRGKEVAGAQQACLWLSICGVEPSWVRVSPTPRIQRQGPLLSCSSVSPYNLRFLLDGMGSPGDRRWEPCAAS